MERRTITDQELVGRAGKGDERAFRMLVERYEGQIAGVVIGMLGRNAEAEDAGQETFIRFYRSLEKFRGESQVGTYLTRIAVNLCLDVLRKRKKRFGEVDVEEAGPELMRLGGDRQQEKAEARELLHKALEQLEPECRTVILLLQIEGYSTKETAQILEIPTGTVLSRLKRGQDKLRKILTQLMNPRKTKNRYSPICWPHWKVRVKSRLRLGKPCGSRNGLLRDSQSGRRLRFMVQR